MDLETARAALSTAEAAFGCGEVAEARTLGAFWLTEGALLWFENDREGATDSLRAAHRVAPDLWYVDFGPALLEYYEAATAEEVRTGGLSLKNVDPAYRTWVDGQSMMLPREVPAGLHLVQIGTLDEVRFGRVLYVVEDRTSAIEPELPVLEREVEATPSVDPASASPLELDGWVAAGTDAWLGVARASDVDGVRVEEAPLKWLVPLEAGIEVHGARAWGRGFASIAPVIGTTLLYETRDEEIRDASVGWRLAGAAGLTLLERLSVGGALGATLPSRADARLVVGVEADGLPVVAEARLGANLLTDGSVEPAILVVAGLRPRLARIRR